VPAEGAKRSPGMEEVVARMRDLATNRGDSQRRSRRDRASLRSTFRDLCSSVEVRVGHYRVLPGWRLHLHTLKLWYASKAAARLLYLRVECVREDVFSCLPEGWHGVAIFFS
jgi:hypothetical protein